MRQANEKKNIKNNLCFCSNAVYLGKSQQL